MTGPSGQLRTTHGRARRRSGSRTPATRVPVGSRGAAVAARHRGPAESETRTVRIADAFTRTGVAAWSILGMLALVWAGDLGPGQGPHPGGAGRPVDRCHLHPQPHRQPAAAARGAPPLGSVLALLMPWSACWFCSGWLVIPSVVEQASGLGTDFPGLYERSAGQFEELHRPFRALRRPVVLRGAGGVPQRPGQPGPVAVGRAWTGSGSSHRACSRRSSCSSSPR